MAKYAYLPIYNLVDNVLFVSNVFPFQDLKQYLLGMSEVLFDVKLNFKIYMNKNLQCLYVVRESTLFLITFTSSLILVIFSTVYLWKKNCCVPVAFSSILCLALVVFELLFSFRSFLVDTASVFFHNVFLCYSIWKYSVVLPKTLIHDVLSIWVSFHLSLSS